MDFRRSPYTVKDRPAVLFTFALRNFKVKIKAFAQEKICETE